MHYEIETRSPDGWAKVQWCADHGDDLRAVRRSVHGLQNFLGQQSIRIVAVHQDGRREPVA